jgi:transposase
LTKVTTNDKIGDMAYSKDLREKVMAYRANHSIRKTAKTYGVSVNAIQDWEKIQRETGKLDKKPLERKWRKIEPAKLREYVAAHPDEFLDEIAIAFECTGEAIRLVLKKHKITYKKNDEIR